MARPRKTGLDYFPHDVDVTTDPKIEPAILRYGAAAYAFYFVHLEYCYRSDDLSVDISAAETGAEMREVIQRKLHISPEDYDGILKSFLRHGAFDKAYYQSTGRLTSNGIKKRAQRVFGKRERETSRYNENVSAPISAAETTAEMGERKENKTKENKSREQTKKEKPTSVKEVRHKRGEFGWVQLTDPEYDKLLYDLGEAELARCIKYIDESAQSNGNKNKWKDWNLVIRKCSRERWGLNKLYKEENLNANGANRQHTRSGDTFKLTGFKMASVDD